jgi:hypothetical protein
MFGWGGYCCTFFGKTSGITQSCTSLIPAYFHMPKMKTFRLQTTVQCKIQVNYFNYHYQYKHTMAFSSFNI